MISLITSSIISSITIIIIMKPARFPSNPGGRGTINLIYDKTGNVANSSFTEYLECYNLVESVPPYRLMDDICSWV